MPPEIRVDAPSLGMSIIPKGGGIYTVFGGTFAGLILSYIN